nr:unnamed protein product [Callosobruchus chinensis]
MGDNATDIAIMCDAQAFPTPIKRWYKFIEGTNRKQAVTLDERVKQVAGTLIIREAKVEDSGKYLCVVNNSVGGESVETVLTVTAPLKAKIEPPVQTVDFGRPAVFSCKFEDVRACGEWYGEWGVSLVETWRLANVDEESRARATVTTGNPIKTISWLKDGNKLDHSDAVLRIEAVRKEDKGMYQCFVRNDQESAEATAELKLGGRFEPPQIRHAFDTETVQPGNSVFLKCIASGNPTPEITWELYGRKLSNNEVYQIGQYVTVNGDVVSHLNISSIRTNDGGLYRCVASSKVGTTEHSARINVYGLPVVRSMEKQAIVAGGTLIVHCPFAGHPVDSVVWERDGRLLPINRKQKVFPNGTLIIENVERASDQATYVCVAKNSQGYSARGSLEVQVMVPPQIHPFDFGEEATNSGDIVVVICTITKGDYPIKMYWTLNSKPVTNIDGVTISSTNKRVSQLTIESVQAQHSGEYICIAENSAGVTKHSSYLNVNVLPQIIPFSFGDEAINSGDSTYLTCSVHKGDLPINFSWLHNNVSIGYLEGVLISKAGKKASTITIDSVQAVHSGVYTCVAENKAGNDKFSARLNVNVLPQIIPFTFGEDAINSGDSTYLTCSVHKGDLPINFSWLHDNVSIGYLEGVQISKSGKKASTLTIESVDEGHSGVYTCVAENKAGGDRYFARLDVNAPPQIMPFSFGEESINSGDSVSATCSIHKGDLPINISWLHNNVSIGYLPGVMISKAGKKVSTVTIDSVNEEHMGTYTCIAENKAGVARYIAVLNVNAPPQIAPFSFGEEPINSGDSTSVMCSIHKGDLPINISWLHNNVSIGYLPGVMISKAGKKVSTVTIDSVTEEHIGTYTCIAENKAGTASYTAVLNVNESPALSTQMLSAPPQIMPFSFGEESINSGDSVSATCSIHKGDLPINISWLHNNISIGYLPGLQISKMGKKISMIGIESVNEEHIGSYTCVAENKAGIARYSASLNVNVPPQIHPFDFGDESINSGEMTSLTCSVHKGDLPMKIYWLHNNYSVADMDDILITKAGKKISTLSIDSVSAKHSGEYTCVAENTAGSCRYSAVLNVNVPPQILPFNFGEESVNSGDFVSVQCTVHKGDLPLNISWLHDGKPVDYKDGITVGQMNKKVTGLTIDYVQESHSGNYTCYAENSAGFHLYTVALHVNVPPQILPFDFGEESVNAGELASLQCSVHKGDLPMQIYWLHNNYSVADMEDILISKAGKKISTLSIDSVSAKHSGEYTCVAENRAGSSRYSARLNVNVPPQILPFNFGEESVNSGDFVSVQCTVHKGDLPLKISWLHDGKPVDYKDGMTVGHTNKKVTSLTIDYVQDTHSGNYTCIAENKAGSHMYTTELHVNVPPQILPFNFGEESVNAGELATLQCSVHKGDLPMKIGWLHNNYSVADMDDILISKVGKKISTLSIDSVSAKHAGEYTCIAENRAGSTRYSATLNVNVAPQIHPFSFGEESVNSGDIVSIQCTVHKGDIPLNITWLHNGEPVQYSEGITATQINKKISSLTIDDARDFHSGNYTCFVQNRAGSTSFSSELHINVPPQIIPFDFGEESVNSGELTSLTCSVHKGDLPMEIYWLHNNYTVADMEDVLVTNAGKKVSTITIDSVAAKHAGEYSCVAKNRAGVARYNARLNVNVAPQIHPFSFGEESLNSGDIVSIQCTVHKGDLPLNITWLHNDRPVHHSDGITVAQMNKKISSLTIDDARESHSGNYTCFVQNRAGSTSFSSELHINVAPQILPFSFGEESVNSGDVASLQCTVHKGDLPLNITWLHDGVPIDYSEGITTAQTSKKVGSLTIDDVQEKHAGNFTCLAENSAGSNSFTTQLHVNGDSITLVCSVHQGDLPINLSWLHNNISIGYLDGVFVTKAGKKASTLTIDSVGAEHSGMYSCVAENKAGVSRHSATLNVNVPPQITPFDFGEEAINSGDSILLACSIHQGDLPINLSWLHNNVSIGYLAGVLVTKAGKKATTLTIESVNEQHVGMYSCLAENKAGVASHTAELNVNVPPQITPFDFGEDIVNSGDSVSLVCTVHKGDLPINLSWLHNNVSIGYLHGVQITKAGKKASTLTIDSANEEHIGAYTCMAENKAGFSRHSAELNVNVPPQVTPFSFGEEPVNSGDSIFLTCSIHKGDLPVNLSWLHNNVSIGYMRGIQITKAGKKASTLTIDTVNEEHTGTYTCVAENKAGDVRYSAELHVNVPPQITPFDFGEDTVNSGDSVSLVCTVHKGDQPINLSWLHNNVSIGYLEGIQITKGGKKASMLTIDSANEGHIGTYTCIAENKAGTSRHSAELNVNVAPQITTFNFGEDAVNSGDSVSLTCSVYKGDSPINLSWLHNNVSIGYLEGVQITKGGKKASMLTIDSADERHIGIYTCIAQNKAGISRHSAELNVNAKFAIGSLKYINFLTVAPQITPFNFGEDTVNSGDSVSLTCTVHKGDSPISLSWLHNNVSIGYLEGIQITKAGKKASTLTIDSANEGHIGTYTCIAENEAGMSRHSADLNVNVAPQITPFDFGEDTVNSGDSVSLTCTVHKGDLPVNLSWLHNNVSIGYLEGVQITKAGKKSSALTIDNVNGDHVGSYTCIAENKAGSSRHSADLHVNVLPHITPFEFEDDANTGDSVQVTCYVSKGDTPIDISWLLNGRLVKNGDGISTIPIGERTSLLTINSVQPEHTGVYTCLASNKGGTSSSNAELLVNVLPHIMPFSFEEEANRGDSVQVQCYINKGDMPMSFDWLLNGQSIPGHITVNIVSFGKKTSVLSIDSVDEHHAGNYSCVAENRAGSSSYTAQLSVKVLPHITPFAFEEDINRGDSVQVQCYVNKGDMPMLFSWLLNGQNIPGHVVVNVVSFGKKTSVLSIDSVDEHHAGNYSCVAENRAGSSSYTAQLTVKVLPHVTPFAFEEDINRGDSVQVQCYVNKGDMPVTFSWLLNGKPITDHLLANIDSYRKRTSVLSMESVDEKYAGNYSCVAANRAGIASFTAQLVVKVLPKIHPFTFGDEPSFVGETISVQCTISSGDLPVTFSWMLNGQPIPTALEVNIGSFGKKVSFLNIDSVSERHSGNYTCIAANRAGLATYSTTLAVKVLPKIHPFTFGDEPSFVGETISVQCTISSGDLPVTFSWMLNGQPVPTDLDMNIGSFGKKVSVLNIDSVSERHAGNYTCIAANRAGLITYSTTLAVKVLPRITPFGFEDSPVHSGQFVEVTCTVSEGDLPVQITWHLNGRDFDNFPEVTTTKVGKRTSVLSIESVSYTNAGVYTCLARNKAGEASFHAELQVNGY